MRFNIKNEIQKIINEIIDITNERAELRKKTVKIVEESI